MATSEISGTLQETNLAGSQLGSARVVPLSVELEKDWDRFVLGNKNGTIFHQSAWKRVMEETYGYSARYFCAVLNGQIRGIAPAFLVSNWIAGKCLLSLPFAVYGGICAADLETELLLLKHLEQLASEEGVQHMELRERGGQLRDGYFSNPRYSTFTIPLSRDTEALYKGFPKDIRYMIRKGEKAGLRARHGFDQLDVFYQLMVVNLRRLGTPAFPVELFENLIREYGQQVDLTVVYSGNKPVAGGMSFRFREWFQPYYVGSLDEAKSLAANNFLWWEMIKLAGESGHETFDFGRSKNGSGNFDFKKKWAPKIEPLNYQVRLVRRKEMPNFSPTNPKFQLASNVWKKMPLGVSRVLGPRVVRWFP
jgi:FemAB-related protein (PEP-CTERM system-associated)